MVLEEKELSSVYNGVDEIHNIDPIANKFHAEQINNNFCYPINAHSGTIGSVLEEVGIIYVQKCLHGECYYVLFDIYGDTDKSTSIFPHSTDMRSLCDNASYKSLSGNPKTD